MDEELKESDLFLSEKKKWYLIEVIEWIKLKRAMREKSKIKPDVSTSNFDSK